jgi:hypothetical protein
MEPARRCAIATRALTRQRGFFQAAERARECAAQNYITTVHFRSTWQYAPIYS